MTKPNNHQEDDQSTSSASPNEGTTNTLSSPATSTSDTKYTHTPSQPHHQPGPSGVRKNAGSSASPNQGATSTSTPGPNKNRVETENIRISQPGDDPGTSGVRSHAGSFVSSNQSTASILSTLRSADMNETENIRISQSYEQPGPSAVRRAMSSSQFQNQAATYAPSRDRRTIERYPALPTDLIDCRYYRENRCNRGNYCRFRHQPASLECQEICQDFIQGRCLDVRCHLRHDENEKNLGEILCKVEKEKIGSCSKVGCPFYHRDLNSLANQAKALFFIRHPLTVEVDGPPLQQFPHDAYRGSDRCFWEHLPGGCRKNDCTFIHENGPFSLSMRRNLLLQIVPRNWWQPSYDTTMQMWHNSSSHIYSVEQWVRNVSAGHHVGMVVGFPTTTMWMSCCLSSISEQPPLNWPVHYVSWDWVLGAAAAHWTPDFGQHLDPEWESRADDEQWESESEQQSSPRQINPQLESLRWPPIEINPEWSTSVVYSGWATASVQQSPRWPQQQIYPQRRPQQIYPQRLPQQIYPQRPPQLIYPQRPPQQIHPQRLSQPIYPQRPPHQIYPQRPPHQIYPQRPPQQIYPQRPPQHIYPQRPSQHIYPQMPPQHIYPQRSPQQFYPQRPVQQIYPQRPPQPINPQWPPLQYNPQRLPQPINPQRPAGAVNAQWSSVYMHQSTSWSPQPIYPQQPPQQPPQQINGQWSWGWQQVAMAAGWQSAQYSYYIGPWSQNMLLRMPVRPSVYFSP